MTLKSPKGQQNAWHFHACPMARSCYLVLASYPVLNRAIQQTVSVCERDMECSHSAENLRKERNCGPVPWLVLAGQLFASDLEPVQIAKGRDGYRFGLEELIGQSGEVARRHSFDSFNQFIKIVVTVEIHLLPRQI